MATTIGSPVEHGTRALAEFTSGLRFSGLPPDVVQRTKELALDFFGVALRGSTTASGQTMASVVAELSPDGSSTLIGHSRTAAPQYAALANGTSGHSIEMDDVTGASSLHPGVTAFPAALAQAEALDSTPGEFLAAVVAGYEVIMRVGEALNGAAAYEIGFHPTGVCGVFGAAAISASLLGLDEETTARAMGIAGSMASGSLEYLSDGSWTKRLNPGWAAHSGLLAARMARAGYTGPTTILEGSHGFLAGYTRRPSPDRLTAGLGGGFKLLETNIKVHACCRYMHGPIDCVLDLVKTHDVRPDQIEEIRCAVLTSGRTLVADPPDEKRNPTNTVDAQFSMPYGAAVAAVRRSAGLDAFEDDVVRDPAVRTLLPRVVCESDPELDAAFPDRWGARAAIRLRDGRTLTTSISDPRGGPEMPLRWDDLVEKFTELTEPIVSADRAEAIISAVREVDRAESLRPLGQLLRSE